MLTIDGITLPDRVYTSDRNGDTAQECINIDMIKLFKDEIAFLRGKLSRELRSNQNQSKSDDDDDELFLWYG